MSSVGERNFFAASINNEDGSALIFISYPLLHAFSESNTVFLDGTFRTVPKLFYQLVTLQFLAFNKVNTRKRDWKLTEIADELSQSLFWLIDYCFQIFPIAYVLMTNKSQKLYEHVLKEIIEITKVDQGKSPTPSLIISDFELAILGAASSAFPTSRVRGCWFHFSQVWIEFLLFNIN